MRWEMRWEGGVCIYNVVIYKMTEHVIQNGSCDIIHSKYIYQEF